MNKLTARNSWHIDPGMIASFNASDFDTWFLAGEDRSDRVTRADEQELLENCIYISEAESRRMEQTYPDLREAIRQWANTWNK